MSDSSSEPKSETKTSFPLDTRLRLGLAILAVSGVFAGGWAGANYVDQGIEGYPTPGPGETMQIEDGPTIIGKPGGALVVSQDGSTHEIVYEDQSDSEEQSASLSESEQQAESIARITGKAEELREQVNEGDKTSEEAQDELAIYVAGEFGVLAHRPPNEEENRSIDIGAEEVILTGAGALLGPLVQRSFDSVFPPKSPKTQPGPAEPGKESTNVDGTSR